MKPTHDIIDPELEARIVAWVLGEASPFETAELERRCREQPELAGFKQHIQHTHELAAETMRPATPRLRLNAARREKLLHTLRDPAPSIPTEVPADSPSFDKPVRTLPLRTPSTPRDAKQGLLRAASALLRTYGLAASVVLGIGVFLATRSGRDFVSDDRTEPQLAPLPHVFEAEKAQVRERAVSLPPSQHEAPSPVLAAPQPAPRSRAIIEAEAAKPAGWFGETIIESPFEVTTEADAGYTATNTLAGNRLRTELRDIASPFSTVKPELFDDAPPPPSPRFHEYTASSAVADATNANDHTYGSIHFDPGFLKKRAGTNLTLAQPFFSATPGAEDLADVSAPARLRGIITVPDASSPVSDEVDSRLDSVSTFSMHVSDVSFRLAQAALARGELPDAAQIRPEEFYNAFDYGDPAPAPGEKIACRTEQAAHPFLQQRNLLRIALRVPSTGRNATQPLRLTVLLDTSGSMERTDRAQAVQRALEVLASLLGPDDRVTLIGFARQPRLIAEALTGDAAANLATLAAQTPAEGGTNLEAALELAIAKARQHADPEAQNRIVLLTDGAANLGNANAETLAAMITRARQQGLAFDACGVGLAGLDDTMLEALTRQGDGRYYVLDGPEDADAGFARQLAGALRPAAQNVKLQVRFNPARVLRHRLIGFEQHRLREQDFRDDRVDAAELAADESAVAVYQIEVDPAGIGELGDVYARFRDTSTDAMVERSWTMPFEARARSFANATPAMQLAGVAAMLAEALRGGHASTVNLGELAPIVNELRVHFSDDPRVQELVTMFDRARRLIARP